MIKECEDGREIDRLLNVSEARVVSQNELASMNYTIRDIKLVKKFIQFE